VLAHDLGNPVSVNLNLTAFAKEALRRFLSQQSVRRIYRAIGVIDYTRSPERGAGWGPFNGQAARQALFVEMMGKTRPHAIVETGTFLGTTTELMSQTELPVFTIEFDLRNYSFASARFWRRRNVKLIQGDSRRALRMLFDGDLHPLSGHTIFFYLDAHWHDDLPLAEEIDIVFTRCPLAVVMIDDFEVPSDAGYGYDDYGPGKALVLEYIKPAISAHQLRVFYPSTPSAADHPLTPMAAAGLAVPGKLRRGCVVLVKKDYHEAELASVSLLRPASKAELNQELHIARA
jgi:hypothetical protein